MNSLAIVSKLLTFVDSYRVIVENKDFAELTLYIQQKGWKTFFGDLLKNFIKINCNETISSLLTDDEIETVEDMKIFVSKVLVRMAKYFNTLIFDVEVLNINLEKLVASCITKYSDNIDISEYNNLTNKLLYDIVLNLVIDDILILIEPLCKIFENINEHTLSNSYKYFENTLLIINSLLKYNDDNNGDNE